MKARELVKTLIEKSSITKAEMARTLGISQQAMYERIKADNEKEVSVEQLMDMLNILGYKIVAIPTDEVLQSKNAYEITPPKRKFIFYTLVTPDGDVWKFRTKSEAERNKYIFGGSITREETYVS